MKLRNIICAVCLLIAGTGYAASDSGTDSVKTEAGKKEKPKVSSEVTLISGKGENDDLKIIMKCRIARTDSTTVLLQARIQRSNARIVHVIRPGITLTLDNDDTVSLSPKREVVCESDWSVGRWDNVSFDLSESDIEKLESHDVVSISIATANGTIERAVPPKRQDKIAKLLRSVEPKQQK